MASNRLDIEYQLSVIAQEREGQSWAGRPTELTISEPIRTSQEDIEIPRSTLASLIVPPSPSTISQQPSILPKQGEEVLPLSGPIHPVVQQLLMKMPPPPPSTTGIPIVEVPSRTEKAEFGVYVAGQTFPLHPEVVSPQQIPIIQEKPRGEGFPQYQQPIEPGVASTFPSPIQHRAEAMTGESFPSEAKEKVLLLAPPSERLSIPQVVGQTHIPSKATSRNVLFIYPTGMDFETVIKCYNYASKTVLHPQDSITIIWAAGEQDRPTPSAPVPAPTTATGTTLYELGEGADQVPQIFSVSSESFDEVIDIPPPLTLKATQVIRERSPFIHSLISETDIKEKPFKVKLQPHANLHWTLQQELASRQEANSLYDLVVLPCFRPEAGSNPELEKFLVERSPCPVVLVRSP